VLKRCGLLPRPTWGAVYIGSRQYGGSSTKAAGEMTSHTVRSAAADPKYLRSVGGSALLLLALGVLLTGCGGDDSVSGSTASTQTTGTQTTRTTAGGPTTTAGSVDPVIGGGPYVWIPVETAADVFSGGDSYTLYPEDLAGGDLGYVVVGYELEEDSGTGTYRNTGSVVWFSEDGVNWTRLNYSGDSGKNWMHAVMAGDPGFLAVGETSWGINDPAVWISADGLSWRMSWTASADDDQEVHAIAAGGPGFVAVGHVYPDTKDAAVWVSPDGISWEAVGDQAALGGPDNQTMNDVVAGGPGLVAVGEEETPDGYDGVVWVSENGRDWSRVADPDGVFGGPGWQDIRSVVTGGPGLVAVGSVEGADQVWTSADGLTWVKEPSGAIEFRGPGGGFAHISTGPAGAATLWGGSVWLGVPCSASADMVASLAARAGGTADDSACS